VDECKPLVPGNIRRAEHFVAFLRRFVEYLKAGGMLRTSKHSTDAEIDEPSPSSV